MAGPVGKKRSFAFIFFVSLFTLGIYWIYWYYKTNAEIKDYAGLKLSPGFRTLYLSVGSIFVIPFIYAYYVWLRDISNEAKNAGVESFSPILNFILLIIPLGAIYTMYKVNSTLNKIWEKAATPKPSPAVSAQAEAIINSGIGTEESFSAPKVSPQKAAAPETIVLVKCPRCKTRNSEDANFCIKCGANLQG